MLIAIKEKNKIALIKELNRPKYSNVVVNKKVTRKEPIKNSNPFTISFL